MTELFFVKLIKLSDGLTSEIIFISDYEHNKSLFTVLSKHLKQVTKYE